MRASDLRNPSFATTSSESTFSDFSDDLPARKNNAVPKTDDAKTHDAKTDDVNYDLERKLSDLKRQVHVMSRSQQNGLPQDGQPKGCQTVASEPTQCQSSTSQEVVAHQKVEGPAEKEAAAQEVVEHQLKASSPPTPYLNEVRVEATEQRAKRQKMDDTNAPRE